MDISRLPIAPLARPAATPQFKSTQQAAVAESTARVETLNPRSRTRETIEPVVQGEFLHRQRTLYQSTRAFIDERTMEQSHPIDHQAGSVAQSRAAISLYLNNSRPEPLSELTRGKSVNLFV